MPVLHTQASSQSRLKNDTLGDKALKELYANYNRVTDLEAFRAYCVEVVQSGGGKQPTKDRIIKEINDPKTSKDKMVGKVQNFILAGMGLGV